MKKTEKKRIGGQKVDGKKTERGKKESNRQKVPYGEKMSNIRKKEN